MVRKCSRGIAEVAVMEVAQVGVRTRARAALDERSSGTAKRRKVSAGELVKLSSPCDARLRSRSRSAIASDNSVLPTTSSPERYVIGGRQDEVEEEEEEEEDGECLSPSADHAQVSCCSSNGSSELAERRIRFVDLEDESAEAETSTYNSCRERREMTPSSELRGAESDNAESTARPNVSSNSRRRPAGAKMPSELELEEFFAAAEKDIQKKFAAKYNYDIAKDAPLEGRYEWIRLKP